MHQSLFYRLAEPLDEDARRLTTDAVRQQGMLNQAKTAALEPWDFAVLEMIRREDMTVPMKVGTMRFTRSMLRLYAHGLVAKLDREPTFDERERLNAFLKSPRFKAYVDNVKDTATKYDRRYFEDVASIMQEKDIHAMWDLTDAGVSALETERQKAIAEYAKLQDRCKNDPVGFYNSRGNETYMPLMLAMGMSGPMIGYMAASDCGFASDACANGVDFVDFGGF